MHIHLDLVGGMSGDMFIASMLDCFPEQFAHLQHAIEAAGFPHLVSLQFNAANDDVLTGSSFKVVAEQDSTGHQHRHYSDIVAILESSQLDDDTRTTALEIFALIARAEAKIHGKEMAEVAFHEVGAWDSIADIVCAAWLVNHTGVVSWSVSKIPIGKGQVLTAHGRLPVPAPATSLLLEGFEFYDDGLEGERVTPTGAAILKYLAPAVSIPAGAVLQGSSHGFGSKRFEGISNVLRSLVFSLFTSEQSNFQSDEILQLAFEIDDQSAEQLAIALQKLREHEGVLDVIQYSVTGKKGRSATSVRVLADPEFEAGIVEACFNLTTTLGIREQLVGRTILPRREILVAHNGEQYRVKVVQRPNGITAKVDIDDLGLDESSRQIIEAAAIDQFRQSSRYREQDE